MIVGKWKNCTHQTIKIELVCEKSIEDCKGKGECGCFEENDAQSGFWCLECNKPITGAYYREYSGRADKYYHDECKTKMDREKK